MKNYLAIIFLFLISAWCNAQGKNYDKGLKAFDSKSYGEAFKLLKPYADSGEPTAQFVVGYCYLNKDLGFANDSIGEVYLLKSASNKYGRAMGLLSAFYFQKALNDPKNKIDALVWAETAAAYDPIQQGTSARYLIRAYMSEEELKQVENALKEKKKTFDKIDLTSFYKSNAQYAANHLNENSPKTKIPENKLGLIEDPYRDWVYRWKNENFECDKMFYTAKVEEDLIDSAIIAVKAQNKFKVSSSYYGPNKTDLTLTAEEQKYLAAELIKLKGYKWDSDLFPYSERLELEDIEEILKKNEKLKTEKEKNMCSIIYTFSRPIFFRDKTLCLFLDQKRYRQNYTQLSFNFYVFENDRWKEYVTIYSCYENPDTKNKRSQKLKKG